MSTKSKVTIGITLTLVIVLIFVVIWVASSRGSKILDPPVVVGTGTDKPGIEYQDSSTNRRSGFTVNFYQWLAKENEFTPSVTDVNVADRESALRTHQVDLVFSSYTISDERERLIDFAGPYMTTFQGVMVRADNSVKIETPEQLAGKSVCAQGGSTSIAELRSMPNVLEVEKIGLGQCVESLKKGEVQAVSTDQLLLYGYANLNSDLRVMDNLTFGALQKYGIGLPPEDGTENCELMTKKIREFIVSDAWNSAFRSNFGNLSPDSFRPDPSLLRACIGDEEP